MKKTQEKTTKDLKGAKTATSRPKKDISDKIDVSDLGDTSADKEYDAIIKERAEHVFNVMRPRTTPEQLSQLRKAFEFAREAHASQKRKTGEPYILHPIAVAAIAAEELNLSAEPVIAAFLHDVVEDTPYTIADIEHRFGRDVAFLVKALTKQIKERYEDSKQVDNYRQMLNTVQYDIRAILIKLADRLHNMRTLSSMRPDKQMKIAGETDYFYAPLANRLGLYNVKTELENLSLRFRCPHDYEETTELISRDAELQAERLGKFRAEIVETLNKAGIEANVYTEYRKPYSLYRKMQKYGDDFNHLKYRHFTDIVFRTPEGVSEKDMALKIYSTLTSRFKEKPGGISNYIDSPKENGYRSFHVKLLADFGRWQEVHISSEQMVRDSRLGCVADRTQDNIQRWIDKFRKVLRDIAEHGQDGTNFIENVVTSFYNDDIMTFTPHGRSIILPKGATVLDFAYEVHTELGRHAKYARVNNFLTSVKSELRRGDVVEIFTDPEVKASEDRLNSVVTYKARKSITNDLRNKPKAQYRGCPDCSPIPGEEVIGFREAYPLPKYLADRIKNPDITIHKRGCPNAVRLASQQGDSIVSVKYEPDETLYPVTIVIKAVDRYHLMIDLVDCISNQLNLSISSINTDTVDSISTVVFTFGVHSYQELQSIMKHIATIPGVDEVKRQ